MAESKPATPHRLDVSSMNRTAYLVKVPNYVAESWKAAAESNGQGFELARIRIAPSRLEQQAEAPSTDPTERREGVPHEQPVLQLSPSSNKFIMQLTGVVAQVHQRFDTAVHHEPAAGDRQGGGIDPRYRALTRARNEAAAKKTRTMQVIDDPRSARMAGNPGVTKVKRAEKQDWEHRARMDRDKLENRLFRLFERQGRWKFAELQKATDQPAVWLKEVVSSIGVVNKRGPYIGSWELKREYKVGQDQQ